MFKAVIKSCNDLGKAAYLRMHGYKCIGRKGKQFFFEINGDEGEARKYDELSFEYTNSLYHQFDSHIMSLKKMGDYLPDNFKEKFID